MQLLSKLDMFGVSYTLKTQGREKFTTVLGGVLTLLTIFVITAISLLFGTDFYMKKNPKFLENNKVHEEQQTLLLDEKIHPFMIKINNPTGFYGKFIEYPEGQNPLKPMIRYGDYKYEKGKSQPICSIANAAIKCSETLLKGDTRFEKDDLSQWYCLDYAKVKGVCREKSKDPSYQPQLSGYVGDSRMTNIFVSVANFEYDQDWNKLNISPAEPVRQIFEFTLNIRFPKYYFNSEKLESALVTKIEQQSYAVSPTSARLEYKFLKKVLLVDDMGWVLESLRSAHSVDLDWTQSMYYNNDLTQEGIKFFYSTYFNLNANEKVFKRVYMRIQDVGAQVSGFAKVFISSATLVYVVFAVYRRDQLLIRSAFDVDESKVEKKAESQPIANNTIVGSSSGDTKVEVANTAVRMIGFFQFYMRCCRKTSESERSAEFFKLARQYIDQRLDVTTILTLHEKVERLAQLSLSEEDLHLLNWKKITRAVLN